MIRIGAGSLILWRIMGKCFRKNPENVDVYICCPYLISFRKYDGVKNKFEPFNPVGCSKHGKKWSKKLERNCDESKRG